jgi:hypothetical protein
MQTSVRTGVSYFGNRNPRHFLADLEKIKSHHCDFIVHTFSENEPQIWIQNFKIPAEREDEIRQAVDVAYAAGVRNFAAWSFYGTGYMWYIKPDDPQKVWDTMGEVYGQLVRGEGQ